MRIESLRVELRPRSPWEAMELGTALVRGNARAIWVPWLLATVPAFVLLTLGAQALGHVWIAWLAMWWLKPAFDRIPLYVLSRAVFGQAPGVRATLAAQRSWGWRPMAGQLLWRRLSPLRALTLPVDLLEGADAPRLRERRRVLAESLQGHVVLLTGLCLLFVLALTLSAMALVLLFMPWELLPESVRAVWSLLFLQPPPWARFALHAMAWAATSVVEPFYVGAGFGLYLNRRTQIEAWDVEIAFRRMRARMAATATAMALALATMALPTPWAPAQAQSRDEDMRRAVAQAHARTQVRTGDAQDPGTPLQDVFGARTAEDPGFRRAVASAYRDPLLRPQRTVTEWRMRDRKPARPEKPLQLPWLETMLGGIAEFGLWLLLGVLAVVLAATAPRWWPWLRGQRAARDAPGEVSVADAALPDALPSDIAAAVRALWREGRRRRALALLYRAAVEAMAERAQVALVPGATESECLRAARRMPLAEDRDAFAQVVRMWQYAAYARRMPDEDAFERVLDQASGRFGWAA